MVVSAYHFSRYTNATEARQEANYFVKVAKSYGLSSTTFMVNDVEDSDMIKNINANIQSWSDEMKKLGYSNLIHYTAASWLSTKGGSIDVNKFGKKNFWVARYTKGYTYMTQDEAKLSKYYLENAAWQYTSVSPKTSKSFT